MDSFIHVPGFILAREDLNLQAKVIYGLIIGLSNKRGYCYATNEWMGKLLGLSSRAVSRYVSQLKDLGLVNIEIKKYSNEDIDGNKRNYGTERKIFPYTGDDLSYPHDKFGYPPHDKNGVYIKKKNKKDNRGVDKIDEGDCVPSSSPASLEEEVDHGLVDFFSKKAERKSKRSTKSPVKRKRETFTLSREDGLKISLTDNLDIESINTLKDKYGLSEEEVFETKQEYIDWVNGSSYDPKVWGKDMKIYVDKFCKRKALKVKKSSKPKSIFEELNEKYKAFK